MRDAFWMLRMAAAAGNPMARNSGIGSRRLRYWGCVEYTLFAQIKYGWGSGLPYIEWYLDCQEDHLDRDTARLILLGIHASRQPQTPDEKCAHRWRKIADSAEGGDHHTVRREALDALVEVESLCGDKVSDEFTYCYSCGTHSQRVHRLPVWWEWTEWLALGILRSMRDELALTQAEGGAEEQELEGQHTVAETQAPIASSLAEEHTHILASPATARRLRLMGYPADRITEDPNLPNSQTYAFDPAQFTPIQPKKGDK